MKRRPLQSSEREMQALQDKLEKAMQEAAQEQSDQDADMDAAEGDGKKKPMTI